MMTYFCVYMVTMEAVTSYIHPIGREVEFHPKYRCNIFLFDVSGGAILNERCVN